jgi:hypothetical protein
MTPDVYAEVLGLYPRTVIAWTRFPADATRFIFPQSGSS